MKHIKYVIAATIAVVCLSALVLTGCIAGSSQESRLLWSGTSGSNEMVYKYTNFTGTEDARVRVDTGETIVLAYAATGGWCYYPANGTIRVNRSTCPFANCTAYGGAPSSW